MSVDPTRELPRLRVAVLNRIFARTGGGAESYSIALVEQLAPHHDVHVFAQTIHHQWPGVTYHTVSCPLRKPRWVNQLWYAFATWRATRTGFDVVHSHENTWHGQVQTIHVEPVRLSLFKGLAGGRRLLRWLKVATSPRLLTYLALEGARMRVGAGRQVVVTSPALGHDVTSAYPRMAGHLAVVTPGVNLPQEKPSTGQARQQLGLPATGRLLLLVANDYARKGLGTLLPALALLPGDVQLAVVGHTAQIPRFEAEAAALGLKGRVHFLGPLSDVGPAYCAADVLAHPTLGDTFAMVVLEAMANGLPVVVSGVDWCGISGLLTDGQEAVLLQSPTDAHALAAKLRAVLDDPALAEHLRDQGHQFAARHSWAAAAQACEAVYLKTLTPPT